ncbi:hypothetical protein RIF29_16556 [Crotalaria pallida]|uniref:Uncharacterized protein n=1 Tax=Crotalaria pallida TaxID=3830 RepID=A0AAN9IEK6_CROPI
MGNCVFKGYHHHHDHGDMMVKVVTSNGGIMELYSPITVECITKEFPGHGIFKNKSIITTQLFSSSQQPLPNHQELHGGEVYYLLPLINPTTTSDTATATTTAATLTPYRLSMCERINNYSNNSNNNNKMWSEPEVFPRYNSSGVWKVKLVISPEKLSEILSQESRTEALIESVRTVAKCGNGVPSSVANSDQWSVTSSWKGSIMGLDS